MCQADACTHQLNIQWSIGESDYSCVPVFGSVSGWCMHSPIEYWVKLWSLRLILSSDMHLILGWLLHTPFEYSVELWPLGLFLCSSIWLCVRLMHVLHELNIQWSFDSDYSCLPICNSISGWLLHTPIEYSVKLRPLRWLLSSNIQLDVRLPILTNSIFNKASITSITTAIHYVIYCSADSYANQLNIE